MLYHLDDLQFFIHLCKLLWMSPILHLCIGLYSSSSVNWIYSCSYTVASYTVFVSRRLRISIKASQRGPFWLSNASIENNRHANKTDAQTWAANSQQGTFIKINPPPKGAIHRDLSPLTPCNVQYLSHLPTQTLVTGGLTDWKRNPPLAKELRVASRQQINGPLFIVFGCWLYSKAKLLKRHKPNQTKQWGLVAWFSYF